MRLLVLGSCALFLCLPAFGQDELKADLLSLSRTVDTQLALHLTALQENTHEPSRMAVDIFARGLVQTLSHRTVHNAEASRLAAEIDAVFKSAGTSTVGFLEHIASFKGVLGAMGVSRPDSDKLGRALETIGKQVRGPEDTPVDARPARRFR